MANAILDPKVYSNAFLKLLKNSVVLPKLVSTEFKNDFKKVGNTVYAKRDPEFTVRDGATASIQDVVEGEVAVTMDKQKGVDVEFTSVEDTLSLDSLLKSRVMKSAAAQLAQQVDQDIHAVTKRFYNWVGTPGQAVNSYADLTKAPQRMDEMSIEAADRCGIMHPEDAWAMLGNLSSLTAQEKEARDALTRAKLPILGNIDWYNTQNAASVATGDRTNGAVNGASQNVAYTAAKDGDWTQSLICDGLGASKSISEGEVFTLAGVYAINPRSKAAMPYLQQFTVVADASSDGTGNATLTISPPIITTGAFQNVSAAPADNAVITWLGSASTTYNYNTVFRKESIALVSAKLTMPFSGEASFSTDPDTGLTVRYWRSSDSTNDTHMHRFDILYGVKNVDPRRGVRLSGTA